MEDSDPYSFAVMASGGFEEVDGMVCEREAKKCYSKHAFPDIVEDESAGGSSDESVASGADAGEEGETAKNGRGGLVRLGRSVLMVLSISTLRLTAV